MVTLGDDTSSNDGGIDYCDHCFIPFRKELVRYINNDKVTWQNYSHSLGTESGLFFLRRGRKYAEEIRSINDFVAWVKMYGHSITEGDTHTVEINAAFGKVKDPVNDDSNSQEEMRDLIDFTQLDTVEPTTEFDKKKESRITKSLPTELIFFSSCLMILLMNFIMVLHMKCNKPHCNQFVAKQIGIMLVSSF